MDRVAALARATLGDGVQTRPFGSLAAGLATFQSDVDLALHGVAGGGLRPLAHALKRSGWARDVDFRSRAVVPVIAFVDKLSGCAADVSVAEGKGVDGDKTTRSVSAMSSTWPRIFRPLLLYLKTILAEAELNKPFTGGLGSFKLCALLAVFLEEEEQRCGGLEKLPLGACLLGFLRFVARRFDFSTSVTFSGVKADFSACFAWQSIVAFCAEAARSLEERPADGCGRLGTLVDADSLSRERRRSASRARAAAGDASPPFAVEPCDELAPAPPMPPVVRSIALFDFDGTLVSTAGPQEGKALLKSLRLPWPHKAWWSEAASLQPPLPLSPGPAMAAYAAACAAAASDKTLLVLLSGRRASLAPAVRSALARCGAPHAPHVELYPSEGGVEDTLTFKIRSVAELLAAHGGALAEVIVYEDREEHVECLRRFAATQAAGLRFTVHKVGPAAASPTPPLRPQAGAAVEGGSEGLSSLHTRSESESLSDGR